METVFKVGDKVYCIVNGWGIIKQIHGFGDYPIDVITTRDGKEELYSYTLDGKYFKESPHPTLSFTEYTLNGFSQERPIELPKKGELCLVKDKCSSNWRVKEFIEYAGGLFHVRDIDHQFQHVYQEMKRIKILD